MIISMIEYLEHRISELLIDLGKKEDVSFSIIFVGIPEPIRSMVSSDKQTNFVHILL